MLAFAGQFTFMGLVAVAMGWWTRSRAESLAESNATVSKRFVPGPLGRAFARGVDASVYKQTGSILMGFGVLTMLVSLVA